MRRNLANLCSSILALHACWFIGYSPHSFAAVTSADDFLIVHCLLPGQLRQLGRRTTYISARQPKRITAQECRTRGGEYVRSSQASAGSAMQVWLQKAQSGDADAQTTLGEIFEKGVNGDPDYTAAAKWYQQAAKQGAIRAQISLGNLFERGLGVPQNRKRALVLYRKASGLGDATALDPVADIAPVLVAQEQEIEELRWQLQEQLEKHNRQSNQGQTRDQRAQAKIANLQRHINELTKVLVDARKAAIQDRETLARAADRTSIKPLMVGPSITLVDPILGQATRGLVKVVVAENQNRAVSSSASDGAAQRVIIGRVQAPAGLLSLTLNSIPLVTNAAGVFQTKVTQQPDKTQQLVTLTAIDQQAKRTDLQFDLVFDAASTTPSTKKKEPLLTRDRVGNYHALLIGNNAYQNLPNLETPLNDISRLQDVLQDRYGFTVEVLRNATRFDILAKLNEIRARLTTNDNLLLYYAGHGELDKKNQRGHWLPVDASPTSTANWISNVDVTDILNVMQAHQVLLVVDSCYSGTLTRSSLGRLNTAMTDAERRTWLELMATKRSRVVLASGGLAPVLDIGGGKHSVFAKALLEAIETNQGILPGRSLHEAVAARVAHAAAAYQFEQIPEFAPISRAGHEAGDFLLLPN